MQKQIAASILLSFFWLSGQVFCQNQAHPILSQKFQQELDQLSHSESSFGNHFELLMDAEPSLTKKIEIVQTAQNSIFISAMIYYDLFDPLIQKFNSTLIEKAKQGVGVYIIIDKVNSLLGAWMFQNLEKNGIHIAYFNGVFGPDAIPFAVRCHEKMVLVDGQKGVIGGQNLYDERYLWLRKLSPLNHYETMNWRDTDLYVEGPLVQNMSSHYVDFWKTIRTDVVPEIPKRLIRDPDKTAVQQDMDILFGARFIYNEPNLGQKYISRSYLRLIEAAQTEIIWQANQVVLPKEFEQALIQTADRGVKVTLMTNSDKTSWWQPFWYNYYMIKGYFPFRHTKVNLMLYQKRYNHTKIFYVDGILVCVGSLNHDTFSLENDAESIVMIFEPEFIRHVYNQIQLDLKDTKPFSFPF